MELPIGPITGLFYELNGKVQASLREWELSVGHSSTHQMSVECLLGARHYGWFCGHSNGPDRPNPRSRAACAFWSQCYDGEHKKPRRLGPSRLEEDGAWDNDDFCAPSSWSVSTPGAPWSTPESSNVLWAAPKRIFKKLYASHYFQLASKMVFFF